MGQEHFVLMMSSISAELVAKIAEKQNILESAALEALYSSKLYTLLEQEDTKVWQYSADMLYRLLEQEEQSGTLVFPDV